MKNSTRRTTRRTRPVIRLTAPHPRSYRADLPLLCDMGPRARETELARWADKLVARFTRVAK